MKRPYVVACPVHRDRETGSRFTGRKPRLLTAQADVSCHRDYYDCEHVRIEEIDG